MDHNTNPAAAQHMWAARADLQNVQTGMPPVSGSSVAPASNEWMSSENEAAPGSEGNTAAWRLPLSSTSNVPETVTTSTTSNGNAEQPPQVATKSKRSKPTVRNFEAAQTGGGAGGDVSMPMALDRQPSPVGSKTAWKATSSAGKQEQHVPAVSSTSGQQEQQQEKTNGSTNVLQGQAPIGGDDGTGAKGKGTGGPAAMNFGRYGDHLPYNGRKICRVKGCEGNQRWPDFLCGQHGGGRCRWDGCNLFHQGINSMGLLLCGKHCKAVGATYRRPQGKAAPATTTATTPTVTTAASSTSTNERKRKSSARDGDSD